MESKIIEQCIKWITQALTPTLIYKVSPMWAFFIVLIFLGYKLACKHILWINAYKMRNHIKEIDKDKITFK